MTDLNKFEHNKLIEEGFQQNSCNIYPVIKVELADNVDDEKVIEFSYEDEPIFKKISGDLLCFYGIDRNTNYELILRKQLPKSVNIEQLHTIAIENLMNSINKKLQIHKMEKHFHGYGFTCGGNDEAALILIPEIWDIVTERLEGKVLCAVPSKDLIMFVNSEVVEDINGMKRLIEEIHKNGEKILSKHIFMFENEEITIYN